MSDVYATLESRGYTVAARTCLFLREFSGVTVNFTRNGRADSAWFDAERASELADPDWIAHYEERMKTSLTPVGYSNHEHLVIMQADGGGFYGGFDEFLCALGSSAGEMIESLVNQDEEPLV